MWFWEGAPMSSKTAHDIEVELMSEREAGEVTASCAASLGSAAPRWDAGDYAGTDVDDFAGLSEVVAAVPLVR